MIIGFQAPQTKILTAMTAHIGVNKDLSRGRKKVVEDAVKDLSPDAKDDVIKILRSWEGTASEEKLGNIG